MRTAPLVRMDQTRMLNRTLVPQSVAREIQSMIQNGNLKIGEKIPSQREFSQKFGISRASLRAVSRRSAWNSSRATWKPGVPDWMPWLGLVVVAVVIYGAQQAGWLGV